VQKEREDGGRERDAEGEGEREREGEREGEMKGEKERGGGYMRIGKLAKGVEVQVNWRSSQKGREREREDRGRGKRK